MKNIQNNFSDLVNKIVFTELNQIQQEQYLLEGKEMINEIFETKNIYILNAKANIDYDYGLHPGSADFLKMGVDFVAIISSLFAIYLNIVKSKGDKLKSKMDTLDLKIKLKDELLKRKLPKELSEKISEKYNKDLVELFNEL